LFFVGKGKGKNTEKGAAGMITKRILKPQRIRSIEGSFGFIPHRFLTDGFLAALGREELLLYFFLILASDRQGLSFYGYDSICSLLKLTLEEYMAARNGLRDKDLIAFDGVVFQVLKLPKEPVVIAQDDPAEVRRLIEQSLNEANHDR
jgi:hypothetical protein